MFIRSEFEREKEILVDGISKNLNLKKLGNTFVNESNLSKYAYVWTWLGLPVIQMPEDLLKTQEIIFESQPDFIIETGVAWGGSLVFSASILKATGKGKVIGIDKTIPSHNREAIQMSPCSDIIDLYEGSSSDVYIRNKIMSQIPRNSKVMLVLDSHHTQQHVLAELRLWSVLVSKGNYIIVCDTSVEFMDSPPDRIRPWGKGDNPMTAVNVFLAENKRFSNESEYNEKALTTFHPNGVLKAIS